MAFFRSKLVLKMSLVSICVILFSCLFYFSYSFVAPDGLYQYMEDDMVFQYISFTDAQRIVDHVVKHIPEKVLYSNGPTFDIPLTQFDISGTMQVKYATVRGLDRPKIKDFSYNVETRVLQTTANYEHITLSMVIKNSLEWNAKKAVAPTAVRFDLYKCSLKVRGHFNGAKIWDTFAEITIGSAKVVYLFFIL
ncbi:unnamed protein product [Callosobruchus maculatus]|uniref:Uncharacterized protein n=1 Tax=Callosobruchus maculatus TaxID=64391 RepID=A0A653D3L0_CALMS|nr:unnamed protein product [Callosobruchus maculatus]